MTISSRSCFSISANLLFLLLCSTLLCSPLASFFSAFIVSISFLNSSKPKAANKLKFGSSGHYSGQENVSVFYGFTGTINHRFLTNQSARSISVIRGLQIRVRLRNLVRVRLFNPSLRASDHQITYPFHSISNPLYQKPT